MSVKILIKRKVPQDKAKGMLPLFKQMRVMANSQPGYISGETMRRLDQAGEFLVISSWQTSDDWEKWVQSKERKEVQAKIDALLGGKTEYEIYHYGFKE
jgi:heme-degrading monooxygenase HmoA